VRLSPGGRPDCRSGDGKSTLKHVWPKFTAALAKREWVIYPFFAFLVLVFLLLLPRACQYP
jgi:hypothetical protein